MTSQKVIALANRFRIKLAIEYDEPTNPGGKDEGAPKFVSSDTPLPTAPKKVEDPRLKSSPIDSTKQEPTSPFDPQKQSTEQRLSDPSEVVPEERELYYRIQRYLGNALYAIDSDLLTLRALHATNKFPNTVKKLRDIASKIQELKVGSESTYQPTNAAKSLIDYINENKGLIVRLGLTVHDIFTNKLSKIDPVSIPSQDNIGIPTLIQAYESIYNEPEIMQLYGKVYKSFVTPATLKSFLPKTKIAASRKRIISLILGS